MNSENLGQQRLKELAPPARSGTFSMLDSGPGTPRYRLEVLLPQGERPSTGWPALLLLDGEGLVGTFAEAVQRLSRRSDATGVVPSAIIALTAESVDGVDHRNRDFATARPDMPDEEADGETFRQFVEGLVPVLAARHDLDPCRLALLGHSLAGYFALHMFGSPSSPFKQFAAISPSIWWDRERLNERIARCNASGRRAFLAIGEWEEAVPPWQVGHPLAQDALARRRSRRMIGNVQDMADALAAMMGEGSVVMRLFDDEDHASILTRCVAPVLRFLSEGWRC